MNNALDLVCIWLDSALKCEGFAWDADQHQAATECLREAQKELQRTLFKVDMGPTGTAEGLRRYIFEQLGFLTDDDNRPVEGLLRLASKQLKSSGLLPSLRETPFPPEILADAHQDRVHTDIGAVRAGQSVKMPILSIEHKLGDILFSFIDRLEDQTKEDNAAKIVEEMLSRMRPILANHFNFKLAPNMAKTSSYPLGDCWVENVTYLLDKCPYAIRVREGGGPEDLLASLIVTFMGMERKLTG